MAEYNVLAIQKSVFSIQFKQEGYFTHEVMGGPAASGDGGLALFSCWGSHNLVVFRIQFAN